jgi:hypothetical protein
VDLRIRFGPGEPLGGDRDGHEQQPDQRGARARAGGEEIMDVRRNHPAILAAAGLEKSHG